MLDLIQFNIRNFEFREPYAEQKDFQEVTHCFVDKRMKEMSNTDKMAMRMAGVPCVNMLYLRACTLEGNLLSLTHYAAV